jgi:T-complex protein 1 subunit delta
MGEPKERAIHQNEKSSSVRETNIFAAKAVADAVRTSLGPRGMDKMIKNSKGEVTITNDGATILNQMEVVHPTAKMLVELSKAQDIEAGDGTTSVVVIAGSLLNEAQQLLERGIHASVISDGYRKACDKALAILDEMSIPVDLNDRESLIKAATTSLASKVVSQHSQELAPLAVEAVLKITKPSDTNVDLRDIRVSKMLGGTVDDTELVDGIVFTDKGVANAGVGPTRVNKPKIGLIQFCISAPKTDMENSVVVSNYQMMDRLLREERKYILDICKRIKETGCNVLLIQKSVLRDATNDLSIHYLAKAGILVVRDVERDDVDFISRTLGLIPVPHIDLFTADKLGSAALVEEDSANEGKIIRITGAPNDSPSGRTASILIRGSNQLVIDEAERSLHDALCVVRSLVKKRAILPGGSAPEMEISQKLLELSRTTAGLDAMTYRAYAEALEVVPYTLAENAGLNPISIVTELRNRHAQGEKYVGINVRRGGLSNILDENVLQPLLVTHSAISLATECVRMILKIDDVVISR